MTNLQFLQSAPVVIRRKSDGKFFAGGSSRVPHFGFVARPLKSRSRAILVIRCDLGESLDNFDIYPVPGKHVKSA